MPWSVQKVVSYICSALMVHCSYCEGCSAYLYFLYVRFSALFQIERKLIGLSHLIIRKQKRLAWIAKNSIKLIIRKPGKGQDQIQNYQPRPWLFKMRFNSYVIIETKSDYKTAFLPSKKHSLKCKLGKEGKREEHRWKGEKEQQYKQGQTKEKGKKRAKTKQWGKLRRILRLQARTMLSHTGFGVISILSLIQKWNNILQTVRYQNSKRLSFLN